MKLFLFVLIILLFNVVVKATTINISSKQPIILIDTIGDAYMRLAVPSSCISEPDDSFQVMHSTPLYVSSGYINNPSLWLVGTPLIDGSSLCEDPCIYVMDDTLNLIDNIYDIDTWHELIDTAGISIQNPVSSASFFDDPDGNCYSWATSSYGTYMSDPVLLLDRESKPVLITRVTRIVWYDEGKHSNSVSISYIYAHKFNGVNWNDTTLLIDGHINNGSDLNPQHASMGLMAPSVWIDNDKFIMIVNEDTSANMTTLAAWEGLSLDTAFNPVSTFENTILEGNNNVDGHYEIGILNWELPGSNIHRHTQITKLSDSFYIGFATSMTCKDTSWFGYSYDFENWINLNEPILSGSGWLDQWIYTVHPYVIEETDYWQLYLFASGMGRNMNQGDSTGWYTSCVDMKIIKQDTQLLPGDVNHDFDVNIADLTYMVNYVFKGGTVIYPEYVGDVDHSCLINVTDLVYMVNFIFKGGADPLIGCE